MFVVVALATESISYKFVVVALAT